MNQEIVPGRNRRHHRTTIVLFRLIITGILAFSLFAGYAACAFAAGDPDEDKISSSTLKNWFSYETLNGSLLKIPYRRAVLHSDLPGLPALVVCLHGRSASGTNNESQMKNIAVKKSTLYLYKLNRKAIILAPQCPKGKSWYDFKMLTTLRELIALYENTADTRQIYIMGESAGGYGTWAMMSAYPQLFAAALPAAAYVKGDVSQIQYTPVCAVIGEKDSSNSQAKVGPVINQLISLGAEVRFQVIENADHSACCSKAFTDENLSWVFSHTLGVIKAVNPLEVKGRTARVSYKKLKKKRKLLGRFRVIDFVIRAKGPKTYTKVRGNKKISIDRTTGRVTVKKGLKKGTYKVKVEVLAAGNSMYLASPTRTVSFKIKVK